MARKAEVFLYNRLAGILTEDETGYTFQYLEAYLQSKNPVPVSRLLPLRSASFHDRTQNRCHSSELITGNRIVI